MDVTDLAKQTRKELLALAKQHGVKGVSRLPKQELVDHLLQRLFPQPRSVSSFSQSLTIAVEQNHQTDALPDGVSQQLFTTETLEEQLTAPFPVSLTGGPEQTVTDSQCLLDSQPQSLLSVASPEEQPRESSVPLAENLEQAALDSKFFLGSQPSTSVTEPDVLPASYNDNRIVLLARDPHWVHVYWDFNGERWTEAQNQRDAENDRLVLRVFDVTYIEFNGANAWSSTDVELTPFSTSWYVPVPRPDAAYCAEIGYRSPTGRFVSLGRSNVVTTPRSEGSPVTKVRWLTPPERRGASLQKEDFPASPPSSEDLSWGVAPTNPSQLPTPFSAERPFSWSSAPKR